MKVKYGFQVYTKNQTLRIEESGFFKKQAAVDGARRELNENDSHAVILSYHYIVSRLVQVCHVSRITVKNGFA